MFHRPWLRNLPPNALAIASTLPRKYLNLRMAGDVGELEIYGDIGDGDFGDGVSLSEIANALTQAAKAKSLTIRINSPGGVAADGIAAYNLIRKFNGTVTTVNMGMAASAAGIILIAGHRALASEGSLFMMHEAHGMAVGRADDMQKTAEVLRLLNKQIIEIFVRRTGLSNSQVASMLTAETWFDAKDSKRFKMVDDVIANTPFAGGQNRNASMNKPMMATTWQEVEVASIKRDKERNEAIDREWETLLARRKELSKQYKQRGRRKATKTGRHAIIDREHQRLAEKVFTGNWDG